MSTSIIHLPFSVCMSVYKNDNPADVKHAINSITKYQTLHPTEIVLIVDGPVSDDLDNVVSEFEENTPQLFNVIRLQENKGLGNALKLAVNQAKYDIIARMDSDDVSVPDRFEKQIRFMAEHSEIDLISGQITEFIDDENNVVGKRIVPCSHDEIVYMMKARCPFNHMCVCARRSSILKAGNYQDWHYNEDYYLWIRMKLAGCKFANLPKTLVNVRVGKDMYKRRGGWKYFKSEAALQKYMYMNRLINIFRYSYNVLGRFIIQVAMPNSLRGFVFQKLFRK